MKRTDTSSSLGSALRKVESYQYPRTHVGHISEQQAELLKNFQKLAAESGYYTPESGSTPASHDDETMLRYLRARKFVPPDALKQFKETEDWRRDNKIDDLYESIDVEEYETSRKMYPQWTGRRDKRGIPLYVYEVAPLNTKRMSEYDKSLKDAKTTAATGNTSAKLLHLFALYENLLRFAFPLCSAIPDRPYAETPVSQSNNLVDIAGVSLKQFWNLRAHMQDASQLATAHYPETLDRIFIVGAPSFFPTVWNWIKAWFDPITVSKIFILSKANMESTLKQYIDPENIPRKYGGTLDWEWGDLPSLDSSIEGTLQWVKPSTSARGQKEFPPGPVKWRKNENGDLEAVAIGSVGGKRREETIARLPVAEGLELGPTSAGAVSSADLFGPVSTTGEHTHPNEGQDYFPTSGVTPPEDAEHDEKTLKRALSSKQNETLVGPSAAVTDADSTAGKSEKSVIQGQFPHAEEKDLPIRSGTSGSRFEQQSSTRADGHLADTTPAVRDHEYGDKTQTVEPSTVAQGRKNVDVPLKEEEKREDTPAPSYVEQAQSVAVGAVSAVGAAGSGLLAKVGIGGGAENSEENGLKEPEKVEESKTEDPRIDKMKDTDVEDFIRSQYTSSNRPIEKQ